MQQNQKRQGELNFKNIKIIYDEETSSRKQCKRYERKENLIVVLVVFIALMAFLGITMAQPLPPAPTLLPGALVFLEMAAVLGALVFMCIKCTDWMYSGQTPAMIFMKRAFSMKQAMATRDADGKLMFVIIYKGNGETMSVPLQHFFMDIPSSVGMTISLDDRSDGRGPVFVTIDATETEHNKFSLLIEDV